MNNDELKKRIVEILFPILKRSRVSCNEVNACEQCWFLCEVARLADSLADALIAAGIGDVGEWKAYSKVHRIIITKDDKIKQLYSDEEVDKIVSERAEFKHRAAVAERAFDLILKQEKDLRCIHSFTNCDKNCELCWEEYFSKQKQGYFEQAEKEFEEERKDD